MGFDLGHTISSLSKLVMRINRRIERNNQNTNNNNQDRTFSVNVFLGQDKMIRFVPGVRNKCGVYVPIPEGLEVPFNSSPQDIGKVYLKTASNALKHFGEDLDMRKAPPKYISFKGFKSQKEFNLKHFCFSSFCINGKIKFTFMLWHKNQFCLLKEDIKCVVEIDKTDNELIIGNAILEVIKKASNAYPEMNILSNDNNKEDRALVIDKNIHSKIIKQICKEVLIPIGVFQKGNSRVYLDDNGYFFTVIEFQPSAWDRGTYLNISIHFLWDGTDEVLGFHMYKGLSERQKRFIKFENEEQFKLEVTKLVDFVKDEVMFYRKLRDIKFAKKWILDFFEKERRSYDKSMICLLDDDIDLAKEYYSLFIKNKENPPYKLDELNKNLVYKNIKKNRAYWHSIPTMKKMPVINEWE